MANKDLLALDQVTLHAMKLAATRYLDDEVVGPLLSRGDLTCQAVFDDLLDEFILRFRAVILGEELQKVTYPADWWQAVKDRWFPAWLKRRYPVIMNTVEAVALYPSLPAKTAPGYVILREERAHHD